MADMEGKCIQSSWIWHFAISRDQVAIAKAVALQIPNPSAISFAMLLVLLLCSFIKFRI